MEGAENSSMRQRNITFTQAQYSWMVNAAIHASEGVSDMLKQLMDARSGVKPHGGSPDKIVRQTKETEAMQHDPLFEDGGSLEDSEKNRCCRTDWAFSEAAHSQSDFELQDADETHQVISPLESQDSPDSPILVDTADSTSDAMGSKSVGSQQSNLCEVSNTIERELAPFEPQKMHTKSNPEDLDDERSESACIKLEEPQQGPPYAIGESRILLVDDGVKDSLAMLLTEEMVDKVNTMRKERQAIKQKIKTVDAVVMEVLDLTIELESKESEIERARNQAQKAQLMHAWNILQSKIQKAEDKKDGLQQEVNFLEACLKDSGSSFHETIADVLDNAALLDPLDQEQQPEADDAEEAIEGESESVITRGSVDSLLSSDELFRRAAAAEAEESFGRLIYVQGKFDDRQIDYERRLTQFHEREADGTIKCSRTDFDCRELQHVQKITRNLIIAEERHKKAVEQLEVVGLPHYQNDRDHEYIDSDFSGSVIMDIEPVEISRASNPRIEAWQSAISEFIGSETATEIAQADLDSWDAKTVDHIESVSVVDTEEYVEQIKRWQMHCSSLREEQPTQWQIGLSGSVIMEPVDRRRSM